MNGYEEERRLRKAVAIADQMQAFGLDAESAQWLEDKAWAGFAFLAGHEYETPKWRTQDLVLELLVQREKAARAYAEMTNKLEGIA